MADHQSSYTGAQLDSAIAAYVNRSAGSITLDKDNLSKSIGGGYYSGVTAAFDGTGLNATGAQILTGYTAVTSGGKTPGQMQSGNVSLTLTPSNLSPSTSPNKYVTSASASLDYSSLTAGQGDVLNGKTFIGASGVQTGQLNAISLQTGSGTASGEGSFVISGLTGSPTHIILLAAQTISGTYITNLYYDNGTYGCIYGSSYKKTGLTFTFSNGTYTITAKTSTVRFPTGKTFKWFVW